VSPGAAVGQVAFDADTAEKVGRKPTSATSSGAARNQADDVHGMLAA
jgi:pyruvate,orthophosphate dikinase